MASSSDAWSSNANPKRVSQPFDVPSSSGARSGDAISKRVSQPFACNDGGPIAHSDAIRAENSDQSHRTYLRPFNLPGSAKPVWFPEGIEVSRTVTGALLFGRPEDAGPGPPGVRVEPIPKYPPRPMDPKAAHWVPDSSGAKAILSQGSRTITVRRASPKAKPSRKPAPPITPRRCS